MAPVLSPSDFVEAHFIVKSVSGSEYSVLCPVHGDRNASMRINVAKGLFFCHGCHIKGGMSKLAKLVGVTYSTDHEQMDLTMLQAKLARLRQVDEDLGPRFLPESALARFANSTPYWASRGLLDPTVEAFDLGYDIMSNAGTIAVRDARGRLLGFTRRFLDDDAEAKYKDPRGFRKADNLFASWLAAVDKSPTLVLVEGYVDTMKVWQSGHAAVGQYGSYITPRQIRLLRLMGTVEVITMYDNDRGGRLSTRYAQGFTKDERGRETYDPAHDLRNFFVVRSVDYRRRDSDPGSMAERDIDAAVCNARVLR